MAGVQLSPPGLRGGQRQPLLLGSVDGVVEGSQVLISPAATAPSAGAACTAYICRSCSLSSTTTASPSSIQVTSIGNGVPCAAVEQVLLEEGGHGDQLADGLLLSSGRHGAAAPADGGPLQGGDAVHVDHSSSIATSSASSSQASSHPCADIVHYEPICGGYSPVVVATRSTASTAAAAAVLHYQDAAVAADAHAHQGGQRAGGQGAAGQ